MTSLREAVQARFAGKALLTGMFLGLAIKEQANKDSAFTILDVRPLVDDNGDYVPRFEVVMPSGTYIVSVIEETSIDEEP